MKTKEIIEEIEKLDLPHRLYIVEEVLRKIRTQVENKHLETAAEEMKEEYKSDKNLTAFNNIDFEEFYEAR